MKVAITGCTGMIGLSLINYHLKEGDEIIALAHSGSSRISSIPNDPSVKIIECEMSDYWGLRGKEECDIFYHLAWAGTSGFDRDDAIIQSNNVGYSLDAVKLAASWGAKKFVGVGSQAEYGIVNIPMNENTPTHPISGYGIAKMAAGGLCRILCKQMGLDFNWARVLSVYGENDSKNSLIMYLIDTLLKGESPVLTKCEQIWDYIYSDDCACALACIALKGVDGRTYCIGNGVPTSLKDYVLSVRDSVDPDLEIVFGGREYYPHQPMYLCADISDLKNDTGFLPKYLFKEGIERTIESECRRLFSQ